MTTDLSQPLILVQLYAGKEKLIDGNHRLYKAKQLGIKTLSAYYLTPEQHQKYIITFERELYNKIVAEF
ncbi:MAG TPA: ParB/Srx family N-terminal domain-containing protein [Oscillospiraceae bacterium]|nr:ParB/Srx family N-terminal domain-containing protein [Oscillospiraceae bacterium]HPS35894.1 ParB/Srx family N-terminal domain-containing protein [Oscillospiraceae bacterium]